jgi:hypothetical protein
MHSFVRSHDLACGNRFCGFADQNAVHNHVAACSEIVRRELVLRRDVRCERQRAICKPNLISLAKVAQRNQDIVRDSSCNTVFCIYP